MGIPNKNDSHSKFEPYLLECVHVPESNGKSYRFTVLKAFIDSLDTGI
jgi:hypothetical protein